VSSGELPVHERLYALLAAAGHHDPYEATRFLLERFPQSEQLRLIEHLEKSIAISADMREALRPLTWDMLAEMQRAGMTIGSHTRTHAVLTNETRQRAADEIAGSRRELQRRLGSPIDFFAYPDGGFNDDIVKAVAAAGYRYAFTTCRHRDAGNPMLTIPRIGLWERSSVDPRERFSPEIMSCLAAGMFGAASRCSQAHA
jgi:peptidoglycan/xylan/chitin deacetylase (PgdA/CDA1 family)